jgi:hypothetical protein
MLPATVPSVHCVLAKPDPSVTELVGETVPFAPVALHWTVTPAAGLPPAVTSTTRGEDSAVFTTAVWPLPLDTATFFFEFDRSKLKLPPVAVGAVSWHALRAYTTATTGNNTARVQLRPNLPVITDLHPAILGGAAVRRSLRLSNPVGAVLSAGEIASLAARRAWRADTAVAPWLCVPTFRWVCSEQQQIEAALGLERGRGSCPATSVP